MVFLTLELSAISRKAQISVPGDLYTQEAL